MHWQPNWPSSIDTATPHCTRSPSRKTRCVCRTPWNRCSRAMPSEPYAEGSSAFSLFVCLFYIVIISLFIIVGLFVSCLLLLIHVNYLLFVLFAEGSSACFRSSAAPCSKTMPLPKLPALGLNRVGSCPTIVCVMCLLYCLFKHAAYCLCHFC